MYTCYQVILIAEDGEYVLSEWQTQDRAIDEAAKIESNYSDGRYLVVRSFNRGF